MSDTIYIILLYNDVVDQEVNKLKQTEHTHTHTREL